MYICGEWAFRKWHWIKFLWYRLGCYGWIQMDFWPQSVHFRRRPFTIFRKHMPPGMGTERLGMIGCIFAENGPLECDIESSFWGTGWGAKGDSIGYSYLYPYIFESRTHTFFESTCPELYAQHKVGNYQMHIRGEMTSGKWTLSGFVRSWLESLWWFEVEFFYPMRSFLKGVLPFSESTCPEV